MEVTPPGVSKAVYTFLMKKQRFWQRNASLRCDVDWVGQQEVFSTAGPPLRHLRASIFPTFEQEGRTFVTRTFLLLLSGLENFMNMSNIALKSFFLVVVFIVVIYVFFTVFIVVASVVFLLRLHCYCLCCCCLCCRFHCCWCLDCRWL